MSKNYLNNIYSSINPAILAADAQIQVHKMAYASVQYERIMNLIFEFEQNLKPNEEVGAYLTAFGKEIIIQIESVGYMNPYLIIFRGKNTLDSSVVQLVQHVTQINLMFVPIKLVEDRKPYRIGFPSKPEKNDKEKI